MSQSEDNPPSSVIAAHPLDADAVKLGNLAADLSSTLCSLQEKCGHETTSTDIASIATELTLLSQALWRLHEAMIEDPKVYTESFNEDLFEITKELRLIFEEITDCCEELQKADPESAGSVAWMFKKSRVHKLQKHLEALKSTITVMRMVLWHGKDYGVHNPEGRLAGSSPHLMQEGRIIMESVFACNRNAIVDIHKLDSPCHKHSPSSSSESPSASTDHRRKPSTSTGVECPPIPDILPTPNTSANPVAKTTNSPARRFSKRGARLALHSSILNMEANDVPNHLKKKWIQCAPAPNHQSMSSLSRISEVDTVQSSGNLRQATPEQSPLKDALRAATNNSMAIKPPLERNLPSVIAECPVEEAGNKRLQEDFPSKTRSSINAITTPLRKVMKKLSLSHETPEEARK